MSDLEHDLMAALNWAGIDAAASTADFELAHELAKAPDLAGYVKPRTITTAEELEALPAGSVIYLPEMTGAAEKFGEDDWIFIGNPRSVPSGTIPLPATLIYEDSE